MLFVIINSTMSIFQVICVETWVSFSIYTLRSNLEPPLTVVAGLQKISGKNIGFCVKTETFNM